MNRDYVENQTGQIAASLISTIPADDSGATVIGLAGDLGAGKTTLVKALASLLGVQEVVVSPTFVIAKFYQTADARWQKLIHIDAYRIEEASELQVLGWENMLHDQRALIIVEWPERIEEILPSSIVRFRIDHDGDGRRISSH